MGLHFDPSANASYYLDVLSTAADANSEKFDVYTPQTMPERYHFAHSTRIAPIYVVPKMGYVLTTHAEGDVGLSKGVSEIFATRRRPTLLINYSCFRRITATIIKSPQ
jgi:hypothetical protein